MSRKSHAYCKCCGRSLTNDTSIILGIGPVCRMSAKKLESSEKTENMFANRSSYSHDIKDDVLMIEDLGGDKSVTNDIENVLRDLSELEQIDLTKVRIMYRDSMGIWDGIKYNGPGRDVDFFALSKTDRAEAMEALKRKTDNDIPG